MAYYAGLDISLKEVPICIVDDDGEVGAQGTAPADPERVAGGSRTDLRRQSGSCMKMGGFRSGCIMEWCSWVYPQSASMPARPIRVCLRD